MFVIHYLPFMQEILFQLFSLINYNRLLFVHLVVDAATISGRVAAKGVVELSGTWSLGKDFEKQAQVVLVANQVKVSGTGKIYGNIIIETSDGFSKDYLMSQGCYTVDPDPIDYDAFWAPVVRYSELKSQGRNTVTATWVSNNNVQLRLSMQPIEIFNVPTTFITEFTGAYLLNLENYVEGMKIIYPSRVYG
jgi:choice-of-anchor A domain-containing protein